MLGTLLRTAVKTASSVAKSKSNSSKSSSSKSSSKSGSSVSSSKSSSSNRSPNKNPSGSSKVTSNNVVSKPKTVSDVFSDFVSNAFKNASGSTNNSPSITNQPTYTAPSVNTKGVQFDDGLTDQTKKLLSSIVGSKYYDPNYGRASASQLAKPNKSGSDPSGILVNDNPVSVDFARAINPLYDLNQNRQNLILNALKNNDWTDYNNFSAQQSPLEWDQGQDGNFSRNKNYYATGVSNAYDRMMEAQREGDAKGARRWEQTLRERINEYNQAPGMAVYIPRFHSSNLGEEYGIIDYDRNYFDSVYNQGSTGFIPHQDKVQRQINDTYAQNPNINQYIQDAYGNGGTGNRNWYDNPYYKDNPNLIDQAIESGIQYGSEDLANQSWNVNQNYYNQPSLTSALQQYGQQPYQYEEQAPSYYEPSQPQGQQGMTQQEIDAYIQQLLQAYGQNQQSQQDAYMQQYQQYVQELMNWYRQMNEQNLYQNSINQYYNQRPQGQQSVYSPFI